MSINNGLKSIYTLYHNNGRSGINIYKNNKYIGKSTSYSSIAHNGKCIGSIQIENANGEVEWLKGWGVFVHGFGIKMLDS